MSALPTSLSQSVDTGSSDPFLKPRERVSKRRITFGFLEDHMKLRNQLEMVSDCFAKARLELERNEELNIPRPSVRPFVSCPTTPAYRIVSS